MSTATQLGSVSTGTLRTEDLLEAFVGQLECILREAAENAQITEPEGLPQHQFVRDARSLLEKGPDNWTDDDQEAASSLVNEDLMDALNEYAPPCCYFGAHPGDGADFGFWISEDAVRDGIHDGDILLVEDSPNAERSTIPEYLLHRNDHGNETLYRIQLEEAWSVV